MWWVSFIVNKEKDLNNSQPYWRHDIVKFSEDFKLHIVGSKNVCDSTYLENKGPINLSAQKSILATVLACFSRSRHWFVDPISFITIPGEQLH